jgi:glycosyltransferase involved in cell wall biosynthesis/drug/metabolite transporter (DMT)-like permease
MSPLGVGLGLAVLASVALNASFLLQHAGSRAAPPIDPRRPARTLLGLLGSSWWLAGLATGMGGWALHVAALARAPLSLVQAFAAGGLALTVPVAGLAFGERLRPAERLALALMVGALALLAAGAADPPARRVPSAAMAGFLALAAVAATTLAAGARGPRRAVGLGAAGGVLYGAGDAATKALTIAARQGLVHAALSPWLAAVALATAGAFLCFQRGLQIGPAVPVIALMTAATNLVAILAGLVVFGDPLGPGAGVGASHLLAFGLVMGAGALLARAQARLGPVDPDPLAPVRADPPRIPSTAMRVHVVDPSAYAPPYDHALCAGLARAGADVELVTSPFFYGPVPAPEGYVRRELFYRRTPRAASPRLRGAAKLAQHVPDMLAYRAAAAAADVVHVQWMPLEALDAGLLPRGRPLVMTAHEVMPRTAKPGQAWGRRRLYARADAVVAHTTHGRRRLVEEVGLPPEKVAHIPHGVFDYLTRQPREAPLPAELAAVEGKVVLCLGVWRPYHGLDVLLEAWRGVSGAELWVAGLPRMPTARLLADPPARTRFHPRFVTDPELPAFFRRADLVVLPYRAIEASGVLFTALAFGRPVLATRVGGFLDAGEVGAARLVAPGDPLALRAGLQELIDDDGARARLAAGARAAAAGVYAWDAIARQTLELYARLGAPAPGPVGYPGGVAPAPATAPPSVTSAQP